MENQIFLNAGIPPPPLHLEPSSSSSMATWQSLLSAMEMQASAPNFSSEQTENFFYNPNWEKSTDHGIHFDSTLSSMVSSHAASNSNICNNNFIIRELIGKLGSIGGGSGEISPHSQLTVGAATSYVNGNNSTNTSCYTTPLNSPPKMNIPLLVKENLPNFGKSMAFHSSVAELSADPAFAERAAKFSCFGSRSFNGRTSQFVMNKNNAELTQRSTPLMEKGKLCRVSSSPVLKAVGSQMESKNCPMELANSQEESTLSEQNPNGEIGVKASNHMNSRKRKACSKGKTKETSTSTNPPKPLEVSEDSNAKRSKRNENQGNESGGAKADEESKGEDEKQNKSIIKPPEPPKDYIHVRARRGQATDSHSLAERVRREKISERMKLLQDLVPGCNKVTGKALMLDEIIKYVQSLQRQVEFLSMKFSSVNNRLDFSVDNLSKNIFRSNNSLASPIFPHDSSAQAFYGHHQPRRNPAIHSNISSGNVMNHSSVDLLDATTAPCQNLSIQLPLNSFDEPGPQYPITFSEEGLHTIVQMGFGQSENRKTSQGSNQVANVKVEL